MAFQQHNLLQFFLIVVLWDIHVGISNIVQELDPYQLKVYRDITRIYFNLLMEDGLVVKALDFLSRSPVFKTTG